MQAGRCLRRHTAECATVLSAKQPPRQAKAAGMQVCFAYSCSCLQVKIHSVVGPCVAAEAMEVETQQSHEDSQLSRVLGSECRSRADHTSLLRSRNLASPQSLNVEVKLNYRTSSVNQDTPIDCVLSTRGHVHVVRAAEALKFRTQPKHLG